MEGSAVVLWIFDNDGTLYNDTNAGKDFWRLLLVLTSERLSLSTTTAEDVIKRLKRKWQTEFSIIALWKEYGWDIQDIIAQTYLRVALEDCHVTANESVAEALTAIKGSKVVFTANPSSYARKITTFLGLESHFTDIIGIEETGFYPKPNPRAFAVVDQKYPHREKIYFCDDRIENLVEGQRYGWHTILYDPFRAAPIDTVTDHDVIHSFKELLTIISREG